MVRGFLVATLAMVAAGCGSTEAGDEPSRAEAYEQMFSESLETFGSKEGDADTVAELNRLSEWDESTPYRFAEWEQSRTEPLHFCVVSRSGLYLQFDYVTEPDIRVLMGRGACSLAEADAEVVGTTRFAETDDLTVTKGPELFGGQDGG